MNLQNRQHHEHAGASADHGRPGKKNDAEFPQQEAARQPKEASQEAGDDPPGSGGSEQAGLAQPDNDVEEHRRQEDAEQRHAEHAAEDGNPQRPAHLRPGSGSDH